MEALEESSFWEAGREDAALVRHDVRLSSNDDRLLREGADSVEVMIEKV